MAKKDDTVSKRLAEEIALAKRIKDRIKNPPSPSLLDLVTPDQLDELAASLWLNEKDPSSVPSAARSKPLAWTIETIATGTTWRSAWRASFSLYADPVVRGRNGPPSGCSCSSRRLLHTSARAPRFLTRLSVAAQELCGRNLGSTTARIAGRA
jgi:hypothetical protein